MAATDLNGTRNAIQHLPMNEQSIDELLQDWRSKYPNSGILALLPEQESDHLPVLQACCRRHHLPLTGAIFPALLIDDAFVQQGVLLFRFDQQAPSFLLPALNEGDISPEEKIARVLLPAVEAALEEQGRPSLYMFFDGMLPNIASILDGLYLRLSDRVSYAGVNAGSESFQAMPCLFDNQQVISGGVLCLLLPSWMRTTLEHGYAVPRHVMNATSTAGNRIINIDWRPAFEVYQEIIKEEYGIELSTDNFYHYAVHFPFGILRANRDVVVRIPVALHDDGSLFCVGEVPENTMLVLLRAPEANEGDCISRLTQGLTQSHGPLARRNLLTFYCAGRRMHLGDNSLLELTALVRQSGTLHLFGALSLGEIGSTGEWDYPMFHNAALVCTPWNLN